MEIKTIVDAGPLIGWLNAADQWHEWSVAALSARRGPLHTTEIVLGEACWQLGGNTQPAHALLDLVRKGALVLARLWPEHLADTQQIMLKYPAMDAAAASLVSLAEGCTRHHGLSRFPAVPGSAQSRIEAHPSGVSRHRIYTPQNLPGQWDCVRAGEFASRGFPFACPSPRISASP